MRGRPGQAGACNEIAQFTGTMSGSMQNLDPLRPERDFSRIREPFDVGTRSEDGLNPMFFEGVKTDIRLRVPFGQGAESRDVIVMRVRKQDPVQPVALSCKIFRGGGEVALRVDPGGPLLVRIQNEVNEIPMGSKFELFNVRCIGHLAPQYGTATPMSKSPNLPSGFGWSQGQVAAQPHVAVPEGTFEEEHGRQGFFGRVSHLYHRHPPTGWLRIEGPLQPHAYLASQLMGEANAQPTPLLGNSDVQIGIARFGAPVPVFFRNADGDEVRFVHSGQGTLETDYGDLSYRKGDYLVIPRGTTYRFETKTENTHLVIESATEIGLPDRGMLGRHAQFDPMIMRTPLLPAVERKSGANSHGEFELQIKREGALTKVFYPWNPMNAAGWKGDLAPWGLNVDDIRPVVSPRYHLPPSVHTTFLARNFVICSFLPRPLESGDGAMKVPFYHRNIDFDEVLFYHAGNFFSREGISAGAVTWHPQGIHHGPHPNAATNAKAMTVTEEIAVMVDTYRPLRASVQAAEVEVKEYAMSWQADQKR